MDMVWATWHAFIKAWTSIFLLDVFRSIDQCISMSDAALRYRCDNDNSIVFHRRLPSPLLFLFYYDSMIPSQDLETAFQYLCNVGYDMEEGTPEERRYSSSKQQNFFRPQLVCSGS